MKILECKNLAVSFGPLLSVDNVSLAVGRGEILGLIGPVGSGKTTFLRALAGLQPINAGAIRLNGKNHTTAGRNIVGFSPANETFDEDLTVRELLRSVAVPAGIRSHDLDDRIDCWLERTNLIGFGYSRIKRLSRSMKQRLSFARALLPDPALVLLDEPAGGLDLASRTQFRHFLYELRRQGKAVIFTSSSLTHDNECCTHIAMMNRGKVVGTGMVSELSRPFEAVVRSYRVSLSRPVFNLPGVIALIDGAVLVDSDRLILTLKYPIGDGARLLDALIMNNLPVASFNELSAVEQSPSLAQVDEPPLRIHAAV